MTILAVKELITYARSLHIYELTTQIRGPAVFLNVPLEQPMGTERPCGLIASPASPRAHQDAAGGSFVQTSEGQGKVENEPTGPLGWTYRGEQ